MAGRRPPLRRRFSPAKGAAVRRELLRQAILARSKSLAEDRKKRRLPPAPPYPKPTPVGEQNMHRRMEE